MNKIIQLLTFSFLLLLWSCTFDKEEVPEPTPNPNPIPVMDFCDSLNVTFAGTVVPILNSYCVSCHSNGFSDGDFTIYAGVKARVDNGSFKERALVIKDMPQGGPPLSQADREKLQCWLDDGAPNN